MIPIWVVRGQRVNYVVRMNQHFKFHLSDCHICLIATLDSMGMRVRQASHLKPFQAFSSVVREKHQLASSRPSVRLSACIGAAPIGWISKFGNSGFYKYFFERIQILFPSNKKISSNLNEYFLKVAFCAGVISLAKTRCCAKLNVFIQLALTCSSTIHTQKAFFPLYCKSLQLKHINVTLKHTNVTLKHTNVTLKHTNVTLKHTNVTLKHNNVTLKHVNVTLKHTNVTLKHTNVTLKHVNVTLKHTNVTLKHTNFTLKHTQCYAKAHPMLR